MCARLLESRRAPPPDFKPTACFAAYPGFSFAGCTSQQAKRANTTPTCVCSGTAACQLYDALVKTLAGTTTTTTDSFFTDVSKPNTNPLPWLFYQGNSYSTTTDVGLK